MDFLLHQVQGLFSFHLYCQWFCDYCESYKFHDSSQFKHFQYLICIKTFVDMFSIVMSVTNFLLSKI